jgi:hypothetical protein
METAHSTLIFVSSLLGSCIAWMAGTELRIRAQRQFGRSAPSSHDAAISQRFLFLTQPKVQDRDQNHKQTGEVRT